MLFSADTRVVIVLGGRFTQPATVRYEQVQRSRHVLRRSLSTARPALMHNSIEG